MSDQEYNNEQQESSKDLVSNTNLPEVRRVWHQNEWYYSILEQVRDETGRALMNSIKMRSMQETQPELHAN